MKILQVITSLRMGGAEKLVTEMVPRMIQYGHQVDVLVFDGTETPLKQELEKKGVTIFSLSMGGAIYNPLYIIKLVSYLQRYDIIHTHNTACQLFVALASKLCPARIITTEHSTNNRRRNWKWYKTIDRWMYNQYKMIVCISDIAEKKLKEYLHHSQDRITTIYNGIDIFRFANANPNTKLKEEAKNRIILSMVAGFRYEKDQDTLIRALKFLPIGQYEVWLIGDGERKSQLQKLCLKEQVDNYVRFLGIRNDIPEILKASDIIIMSSHFEGLSLSSIEGMASGRPFIASDVDGLRDITLGAGILFPEGNEKILSQNIQKLIKDKTLYNETAQQCMIRAAKYDIQHTTNNYLKIYQESKYD